MSCRRITGDTQMNRLHLQATHRNVATNKFKPFGTYDYVGYSDNTEDNDAELIFLGREGCTLEAGRDKPKEDPVACHGSA